MNYILFDDSKRDNLLPLCFMRPVADIRFGILTIREKWEKYLGAKTSSLTQDYLRIKYPIKKMADNILINGSVCPNPILVEEIKALKPNQAIVSEDQIIAMYIKGRDLESSEQVIEEEITSGTEFLYISDTWCIYSKNEEALKQDFDLITKGRKSTPISKTNNVTCIDNVFVEEGAVVEFSNINASAGPVYIGKDAEIMEGCNIRGPFALCENAVIKMGAKIYGATTIGPFCKIGGEVVNSVFFGFSNKAHDGFFGHSVVAEWCNIGADSNTSNLKNTYDVVRLWNYSKKTFVDTGMQFCGLIMGDHSKCGINTMFNTGTVVGVNVNVYGSGFQRNFIPSFSWGGTSGFSIYDIKKAFLVADAMYKRRNIVFGKTEKNILSKVFDISFDYQNI